MVDLNPEFDVTVLRVDGLKLLDDFGKMGSLHWLPRGEGKGWQPMTSRRAARTGRFVMMAESCRRRRVESKRRLVARLEGRLEAGDCGEG